MDNFGWITAIELELSSPSLRDNTADVDRLLKTVHKNLNQGEIKIDLDFAKSLPFLLREAQYSVRVYLSQEGQCYRIVNLSSQKLESDIYGIAVDIGTTTLVMALLDLKTLSTVKEIQANNPQIEIGSDILARIHFASSNNGLETLRSMLLNALNEMIENITREAGIPSSQILCASIAGNTTMSHFLLGLTPYWIIREPYIPVMNKFGLLTAKEIGLNICSEAPCFVFPNVGSYFGGDLIAGILSSGMHEQEEICVLVDVGTNAEVVIGNKDWLVACAGAAGPALEGGVASVGMMAQEGAIDSFFIDPDTLEFQFSTIGGAPPKGICGSGLIDLVSQLFLRGMLDQRGKLVASRLKERYLLVDGIPHLMIVKEGPEGRPLLLGQPEIDALMRSKAAMFTILTTLFNTVGVSPSDIDKFFVAGTFGSYIKPSSAIVLGMIPDIPLRKYIPLGNSSLGGAKKVLTDPLLCERANDIRDKIMYLELNVNQEFMNLFSAAKFIPHTDLSLFPTVREILEHA